MRTLKISLLAIAVVISAGLISAFSLKHHVKTDTTYHYVSSSALLSDMQNIDNWVAEEPGCGTSGDIPCAIQFDGDRDAFASYLYGFTSVGELNAVASEKKESE